MIAVIIATCSGVGLPFSTLTTGGGSGRRVLLLLGRSGMFPRLRWGMTTILRCSSRKAWRSARGCGWVG